MKSSNIYLRAISHEIPQPWIIKISLKMTQLIKFSRRHCVNPSCSMPADDLATGSTPWTDMVLWSTHVLSTLIHWNKYLSDVSAIFKHVQTPRKLLGFHQTENRFGPDLADIKHDYTQEFYQSYSFFISQCPRTGKFRGVCKWLLVIRRSC